MNNLQLILGGPGCGKTTRLLDIVQREMSGGIAPNAIAFVTFTKSAATEAREKAAALFALDAEEDLPWFRTIHSLAYACMSVHRDEIMDRRDWLDFGAVVGETISGLMDSGSAPDAPVFHGGREMGDVLLRICDFAATTLMPLDAAWHALDEPVPWFRLHRFAETLAAFKADTGKMDFTDLLRQYAAIGEPIAAVRVAVIDEAQDLTASQWAAVRVAFRDAERIYVGGDDDQAIYHWAGADVTQFLGLSRAPEVLSLSHRLPRAIHALSQRIASQIGARYPKPFAPAAREGSITWYQHPEGIDFTEGSWMLLARNTYMLARLEQMVREMGMNYTRRAGPAVSPSDVRVMQLWERLRTGKVIDMNAAETRSMAKALDVPKPQTRETARYRLPDFGWDRWAGEPWSVALTGIPAERREYYLACLRRGERLTQPPRVRIETIHGVKGAEADHVMVMTDLSGRTARGYRTDADNEHRVFYVGITRALQSLHLVLPQSDMSYVIGS